MKNYAKPKAEIIDIGNETDIITTSPTTEHDNIFDKDGTWDLGDLS